MNWTNFLLFYLCFIVTIGVIRGLWLKTRQLRKEGKI